ncbi:DUF2795 domain-containing protein [Phaeacidiphilus oryzae]|jgi:hypothetical protein|uniref:DUF2795 domain-containing protein n=1 Tax=Phaeacidiphilus oryzae TaxID=348818 RepID=UPI00055E15A8|nr:DUF2795 domain-containing protein [Phaeacidiphilus oryzae]
MADLDPIELQRALAGAEYPVSREDLVGRARRNDADEDIVRALSEAEAERFSSPADVEHAVFSAQR